MLPETASSPELPAVRQAELTAIRLANEAAERPPYAWTRLTIEDIRWLISANGWITTDEPGPRVDLRQANLVGVSLAGMAFRHAQLQGAVLFQVNLQGTDLFYADLTGADLRAVQAQGAQLAMARMRGARLQHAQLTGATMGQCWLPEADLSEAHLDSADLRSAQMERADLHEASLVGTRLSWARLEEADLRAADLTSADLRSAHLERAQLDSANLREARLEGAWCNDAAFYTARMQQVDLRGARLQEAQLAGAQLAGARWAQCDLTNVDLTRVGDLAALMQEPTGDEIVARVARGTLPERAAAWRTAADATARLSAALAANPSIDPVLVQRLQGRVRMLRRHILRLDARASLPAFTAWVRQAVTFTFIGDGASPGRVALWAAGLVGIVAVCILLVTPQSAGMLALSQSLSSFTTPGFGYFASQAKGNEVLLGIGAIESVLGDLLAAISLLGYPLRPPSWMDHEPRYQCRLHQPVHRGDDPHLPHDVCGDPRPRSDLS